MCAEYTHWAGCLEITVLFATVFIHMWIYYVLPLKLVADLKLWMVPVRVEVLD